MQIGARMIARADCIVNPLFHHVGLFAVESSLGPPLEELAVALNHGVIQTRRS